VLISEDTYREIAPLAHVGEPLEVAVKGLTTPVRVYDINGLGGPYNLFLPVSHEQLQTLEEAVPLQYTVLIGKHIPNVTQPGRLVKLSAHMGEVHADTPVACRADVRMELITWQGVRGHVYGKVTDVLTGPEGGFRVHFTSIPSGVALFFQEMLAL
jgi:adenylate cyclase